MRFILVFLACCLLIAVPVLAEMAIEVVEIEEVQPFTFKDVPANHWASPSVYELVRLGVTNGYPDGTFRGNNKITRYETAVLMAKLANVLGAGVKDDLISIKKDIAALKKDNGGVSGSYEIAGQMGNLMASSTNSGRGPVADYRLKVGVDKNLGEGADVKVNLDTMDYGWFNDGTTTTGGVLATELLDVQSSLKLNLTDVGLEAPVDLKLAFGPGNKQHAADPTGALSSDIGVTYFRPYPSAIASTTLFGSEVSGGYVAKGINVSGKINTNMLTGTIAHKFDELFWVKNFKLLLRGDYLAQNPSAKPAGPTNLRGEIGVELPFNDKVQAAGAWKLGSRDQEGWLIDGQLALNDVWSTGTNIIFKGTKVGSKFFSDKLAAEEWDLAGFDAFDRPLVAGSVNLGGELTQAISDKVAVIGRGDLRMSGDWGYGKDKPNSRMTVEGGIAYDIAPNSILSAAYRIQQDMVAEDTTDLAKVGLLYSF